MTVWTRSNGKKKGLRREAPRDINRPIDGGGGLKARSAERKASVSLTGRTLFPLYLIQRETQKSLLIVRTSKKLINQTFVTKSGWYI